MNKVEFEKCFGLVMDWLVNHPDYEPYESNSDMSSLYSSKAKSIGIDLPKDYTHYNGMIKPFDKKGENPPFCFVWDERYNSNVSSEKDILVTFYDFTYNNGMILNDVNFEVLEFVMNKIK